MQAAEELHYVYDVEPDGNQVTIEYIGSMGIDSPRWSKTIYDPIGRIKLRERPAYDPLNSNHVIVNVSIYDDNDGNGTSRLIKEELRDNSTLGNMIQSPTIYDYDSDTGDMIRSAIDCDNDGQIDFNGMDRIQETEKRYVQDGSNEWWLETKAYDYPVDNDDTAVRRSVQRNRLTGFNGTTIAQSESVDIFDNVTRATTALAADVPLVTTTTDYHATSNNTVQVTLNGLLQSNTDKAQITTTYGHDGFGRQITVTDGRGLTSTTHYDNIGRIDWTTNPNSGQTTFSYGETDGRLIAAKNANDKYTRYDYNERGDLTHIWGDIPQPVVTRYNEYGERVQLSTFRDTSTIWNGTTWPAGMDPNDPEDADITTWEYDSATGLLITKTYADDNAVTYTYTPDGRLSSRTWARNGGITTTYEYDDGATGTGALTTIDYPDGSGATDVAFTYTRTGRIHTVADAVGERTLAYDPNDLWITEAFDADSLYDEISVKSHFKDTVFYEEGMVVLPAHFQRLSRIEVGTSQDPDAHYATYYSHSPDTDRFVKVDGPGLPNGGAQYDYLANTPYLRRTRYFQQLTELGRILRTYDTARDLLLSIENRWVPGGGTVVSKYAYRNDVLGRRQDVARTGVAFSSTHWDDWNYNDRNELTDSLRYLGELDNTGSPQTALNRLYGYDPIGNRTSTTTGTTPLYYCSNELNQYTHTKAVQGDTCPPANPAESFIYDDDGNLRQDGEFTYTWDAENRLICVVPTGTLAAGDKMVEFKYDYLGRRVEKRVFTWEYLTDHYDWVDSDCRRFVYYNWLPLLEIQVTNPYSQGVAGGPPAESAAILRKYTWGLDLAGQNGSVNSIDSAGGIGGLLACYDTNGTTGGENPTADDKKYIYFYDANGNVGQVIDWTNAAVSPPSTAWAASRMVATYEYDPYGAVTASAGAYAADNPFRFSTKYWDDETGLGYWGYRYYSPRLGRWVTRDPIEERGGYNLFATCRNEPIGSIDALGLKSNLEDRTQACCRYSNTVTHFSPIFESTTRYQRTEGCQKLANGNPKDCCVCPSGGFSRDAKGTRKDTWSLIEAHWGACCFCTISLIRDNSQNPIWGHVGLHVACDGEIARSVDFYFAKKCYGITFGSVVRVNPTPRINDDYQTTLSSIRVDCDTAHAILDIAKADTDNPPSYNIIQDCAWYARLLKSLAEIQGYRPFPPGEKPSLPCN